MNRIAADKATCDSLERRLDYLEREAGRAERSIRRYSRIAVLHEKARGWNVWLGGVAVVLPLVFGVMGLIVVDLLTGHRIAAISVAFLLATFVGVMCYVVVRLDEKTANTRRDEFEADLDSIEEECAKVRRRLSAVSRRLSHAIAEHVPRVGEAPDEEPEFEKPPPPTPRPIRENAEAELVVQRVANKAPSTKVGDVQDGARATGDAKPTPSGRLVQGCLLFVIALVITVVWSAINNPRSPSTTRSDSVRAEAIGAAKRHVTNRLGDVTGFTGLEVNRVEGGGEFYGVTGSAWAGGERWFSVVVEKAGDGFVVDTSAIEGLPYYRR